MRVGSEGQVVVVLLFGLGGGGGGGLGVFWFGLDFFENHSFYSVKF